MVSRLLRQECHWKDYRSSVLAVCSCIAFGTSIASCTYRGFYFLGMIWNKTFFEIVTPATLEAEAIRCLNECLAGLYHEGLFMKPDRAVHLGRRDLQFLLHYAKLARICYDRRQRRFLLIPKCRFLHHQMLGLLKEGQLGSWTLNILTFANQLSEDFVGRPSRLARRVAPRTTSSRVLERTFLSIRNALNASGDDMVS